YLITAPWAPALALAAIAAAVGSSLWLTMIVTARRPCPPFGTGAWLGLAGGVVSFVGAQLLLSWILFRPYHIPTGAMEPTLMGDKVDTSQVEQGGAKIITSRGDSILVQRCAYWLAGPRRGEIVVFSTDGISHQFVAKG